MGRTNLDETYRTAFNAAVAQRNHILEEFERLKTRRALVETAARALEPVVFPDEYKEEGSVPAPSAVVEITRQKPNADIWNPIVPVEVTTPLQKQEQTPEQPVVQAVTQVYVRGDGEPDEEIQRRINIAIGRSAAD